MADTATGGEIVGWKYEVEAWVKTGPHPPEEMEHGTVYEEFYRYEYKTIYAGQSLIKAISAARKARSDSGCIRLTWRG